MGIIARKLEMLLQTFRQHHFSLDCCDYIPHGQGIIALRGFDKGITVVYN